MFQIVRMKCSDLIFLSFLVFIVFHERNWFDLPHPLGLINIVVVF